MKWNSMAAIKLYLMKNTTKLNQEQSMVYQHYRPFICSDTKLGLGQKYNEYHIDAIVKRITWTTGKYTKKDLLVSVLKENGHIVEDKFCRTIKFNDNVPFFVNNHPMTMFG